MTIAELDKALSGVRSAIAEGRPAQEEIARALEVLTTAVSVQEERLNLHARVIATAGRRTFDAPPPGANAVPEF